MGSRPAHRSPRGLTRSRSSPRPTAAGPGRPRSRSRWCRRGLRASTSTASPRGALRGARGDGHAGGGGRRARHVRAVQRDAGPLVKFDLRPGPGASPEEIAGRSAAPADSMAKGAAPKRCRRTHVRLAHPSRALVGPVARAASYAAPPSKLSRPVGSRARGFISAATPGWRLERLGVAVEEELSPRRERARHGSFSLVHGRVLLLGAAAGLAAVGACSSGNGSVSTGGAGGAS